MKKKKSKYWIVDVEKRNVVAGRMIRTRFYFDSFKDAIEFFIALHMIDTDKFVVVRRASGDKI